MDPNLNLAEQLQLAVSILRPERLGLDPVDNEAMLDEAEQLARLVLQLDQWHREGGNLPTRWKDVGTEQFIVYDSTSTTK